MLRWTEETLSSRFLHSKYIECKIHRELKIALYVEMIDLFDKGQMWEQALEHCRELAVQYEEELVDFYAMSRLRTQEAGFYDNIMHRLRPEPEYFRVAFYGRSFPAFLQNKVFVYRGKGFERLPEFQSRILDQFPTAELMTKLGAPTDVEMDQPGQLIQINKVEPIMLVPKRLHGKTVDQQILNYYKVITLFLFYTLSLFPSPIHISYFPSRTLHLSLTLSFSFGLFFSLFLILYLFDCLFLIEGERGDPVHVLATVQARVWWRHLGGGERVCLSVDRTHHLAHLAPTTRHPALVPCH